MFSSERDFRNKIEMTFMETLDIVKQTLGQIPGIDINPEFAIKSSQFSNLSEMSQDVSMSLNEQEAFSESILEYAQSYIDLYVQCIWIQVQEYSSDHVYFERFFEQVIEDRTDGISKSTPARLWTKYQEFIAITLARIERIKQSSTTRNNRDNGSSTTNTGVVVGGEGRGYEDDKINNGEEFSSFFFKIHSYTRFMSSFAAICGTTFGHVNSEHFDECKSFMSQMLDHPLVVELESYNSGSVNNLE
ncbi:hypothetical protein H4219_005155 [Mycoemilia scoparia]|uniref:Uncharacterized protein n=1 Tax=Mycoemilia scoparia TaxID=417184 RepID=A0A9W8DPV6_9FUNG|nr:hypothetical protein H4219_005155 [Mycoemilia scoparia]